MVDSEQSELDAGAEEIDYVLAVSRVPPLMAAIVFDASIQDDDGGVTMRLQPLAGSDRTTPVGAVITGGPFAREVSGLFVAHFDFAIPLEAITPLIVQVAPDTPVTIDLTLNAEQPTCGAADGALRYLTQPSPFIEQLTDSTFALISPATSSAHIDPIVDCSGTHAKSL